MLPARFNKMTKAQFIAKNKYNLPQKPHKTPPYVFDSSKTKKITHPKVTFISDELDQEECNRIYFNHILSNLKKIKKQQREDLIISSLLKKIKKINKSKKNIFLSNVPDLIPFGESVVTSLFDAYSHALTLYRPSSSKSLPRLASSIQNQSLSRSQIIQKMFESTLFVDVTKRDSIFHKTHEEITRIRQFVSEPDYAYMAHLHYLKHVASEIPSMGIQYRNPKRSFVSVLSSILDCHHKNFSFDDVLKVLDEEITIYSAVISSYELVRTHLRSMGVELDEVLADQTVRERTNASALQTRMQREALQAMVAEAQAVNMSLEEFQQEMVRRMFEEPAEEFFRNEDLEGVLPRDHNAFDANQVPNPLLDNILDEINADQDSDSDEDIDLEMDDIWFQEAADNFDREAHMNPFKIGLTLPDEMLDQFSTVSEEAIDILAQITSALPKLNRTVDNMDELTSKLNSITSDSLSKDAKSIFESTCTSMLQKIPVTDVKNSILEVGALIFFLSASAMVYKDPSNASYALLAVSLVGVIYTSSHRISSCLSFIGEYLGAKGPVAQSASYDTFLTGALTFLTPFILSKKSTDKIPEAIFAHLGSFGRAKDSLKSIVDFFTTMAKLICDSIGAHELIPTWVRYMDVEDPDVRTLLEESAQLQRENFDNVLSLSRANGERVYKINDTLQKLYLKIPTNNSTAALRNVLAHERSKLTKLVEKFRSACYTDDSKRVEPVWINFAGGPGNFKTQMLEHIISEILNKELTSAEWDEYMKNPMRWIYLRYMEQVYWDGFNPDKKILVFDDAFQFNSDPLNLDNEVVSLTRILGEFPYSVHKADVESKGNCYLKVDYVLTTTNTDNPVLDCLVDRAALHRRSDFNYYVVPQDEFCTPATLNSDFMHRKLDITSDRLPKGPLGLCTTDPAKLLMFVPFDAATRSPGIPITFAEVIKKALDRRALKVAWNKQKSLEIQIKNLKFQDERSTPEIVAQMKSLNDIFGDDLNEFIVEDTSPSPEMLLDVTSKVGNLITKMKENRDEQVIKDIVKRLDDLVFMISLFARVPIGADEDKFEILFRLHSIVGDRLFPVLMSGNKKYLINFAVDNFELISSIYPNTSVSVSSPTTLSRVSTALAETYSSLVCVVKGPLYDAFVSFNSWYQENAFYVQTSCALATLALGTYLSRSTSDSDDESEVSAQSPDYEDKWNPKAKLKVHRWSKKANKLKNAALFDHEAQMGRSADPNGTMIANSIVDNCLFMLSIESLPGQNDFWQLGLVLALQDRIALMNNHYKISLKNKLALCPKMAKCRLKFHKQGSAKEAEISWFITVEDFLKEDNFRSTPKLESQDLILFLLPCGARRYKHITGFIATEKDHMSKREHYGILRSMNVRGEVTQLLECRPVVNVTYTSEGTVIKIPRMYEYLGNTDRGDCGSPLFLYNPSSPVSKLFGFHSAGDAKIGVGYSSILIREHILEGIALFPENATILSADNTISAHSGFEVGLGQFQNVQRTEDKVSSGSVTRIVRSPLYGKWGPASTKPCHLRPFVDSFGKRIDPYTIALSKFCTEDVVVEEETIDYVCAAYFDQLCRASPIKVSKRIYSFEEAVLGLYDDLDFGAIDRSTSPGVPDILEDFMKRYKGKTYWFGTAQQYDMNNPRVEKLKEDCAVIVELAEKGIRSQHVFVDSLKDERKPIAKVDEGKTRMFCSGPQRLLIVTRRWFGAFCTWFVKNRISNGSAIGVNPYSDEWFRMMRYLIQFGNENDIMCGAGDFSGFDGTEKPLIHLAILKIINRWYNDGPVNQRIREVLWCEVVNSIHLRQDVLYEWVSSLPSGHPLTPIINTMYNGFVFRYCFYRATGNSVAALSKFPTFVYMVALGDDNAFGVHRAYREIFNEMTLGKYMAELGLKYTTELKVESVVALRKITEISFLKRMWRKEPYINSYVAPLELGVILEIPYWSKKTDTMAITKTNVDVSLLELSLHGKEVFEKYSGPIVAASIDSLGYAPECTCWELALLSVTKYEDRYLDLDRVSPELPMTSTTPQSSDMRTSQSASALMTSLNINSTKTPDCFRNADSGISTSCDLIPHMASENPDSSSHVNISAEVLTGTSALGTTVENVTDAVVKMEEKADRMELLKSLQINAHDASVQTIIYYLGKPTLAVSGNLSTTDTPSTFALQNSFDRMFTDPAIKNKMYGVFSIRATTVVTIQVNASRFQMGRYILYHAPTGGAIWNSTETNARTRCMRMCRNQIIQLPHVELDVASDTQVQLKIPYVSWLNSSTGPSVTATTSVTNSGGWGLYPYVPLIAGSGSTVADYTAWVHYEDIVLYGNTTAQMGNLDVFSKEASTKGPISGGLSIVSEKIGVAKVFLTGIADTLSWAVDAAAGVASAFGWSKPRLPDYATRVKMNNFGGLTTQDGHSTANILSLTSTNTIAVLPGFAGTSVDEMSIDYLKSIWGYVKTVDIVAGGAVNQIIWADTVTPAQWWTQISESSTTLWSMTPVTFLSQYFGYYRGGLTFRFKFVKTEFHSGRVMLVFRPYGYGDTASAAYPTIADTSYLHKTIIDLRSCNEFEVEVPWISTTSWLPLGPNPGPSWTVGAINKDVTGYGLIEMFVVSPIVAPTSVSQTIKMIIEVKGSSDLEFAQPIDVSMTPVVPNAIYDQMGSLDIIAHAGEITTGIITCGTIGGSAPASGVSMVDAEVCMGEKITSLRQLMKRPQWCVGIIASTNLYTRFNPYAVSPALSSGAAITRNGTYDIWGMMGMSFALMRGGIRVHFVPDAANSIDNISSVWQNNSGLSWDAVIAVSSTDPNTPAFRYTCAGGLFNVQRSDWGAAVQVPMYAPTHSLPTISNMIGVATAPTLGDNGRNAHLLTSVASSTSATFSFWRSAADDFSFGCFTGFPPVRIGAFGPSN